MFNKRGMSPLIATVLLIAFAVSFAVIIMNLPPDNPDVSGQGCDAVKLSIQEAFGKKIFCYDNGQVKFIVQNVGEHSIDGLRFRTIEENYETHDSEVQNSGMRRGESIERSVAYEKTGRVHVEIIPRIVEDNEVLYCLKEAIVVDALPDCSN